MRRHDNETMTPAERERLQIVTVAGTPDTVARWAAEHRLLFAWELKQQGRIGEGRDDH